MKPEKKKTEYTTLNISQSDIMSLVIKTSISKKDFLDKKKKKIGNNLII